MTVKVAVSSRAGRPVETRNDTMPSGRPIPLQVEVQRKQRPAHFVEFELPVIRRADTDAGAFDDLTGDLAQVGAPVHAALDRDELFPRRIDAEHLQHLL